jgi:N-acetylglucosaminyldiphosphoundecaprenol N-acetyl-beta-D-mannosaminyltransferase
LSNPTIIFGVHISPFTLEELLQRLGILIASGNRAIITHVHITGLNIAYENIWFRDFLNKAEINYCDGMGVKLASHFLGRPLPERHTLVDWMPKFATICEQNHKSWFFLGNTPGSAERTATIYKKNYPSLKIVGTHHGFFNFSFEHPDTINLVNEINRFHPDVLFIGLGMPYQEKWLSENWDRLDIQMALTCGGTFDTLAGINKRGPFWMTQNYMEWLSRLWLSPRKYWKRYLRDVPQFLYRIILQKFSE